MIFGGGRDMVHWKILHGYYGFWNFYNVEVTYSLQFSV